MRHLARLSVLAAAVSIGGIEQLAKQQEIKVMDYDTPLQAIRARAPLGGKKYQPNGKREIERRLRKLTK